MPHITRKLYDITKTIAMIILFAINLLHSTIIIFTRNDICKTIGATKIVGSSPEKERFGKMRKGSCNNKWIWYITKIKNTVMITVYMYSLLSVTNHGMSIDLKICVAECYLCKECIPLKEAENLLAWYKMVP